MIKLLVKKTKEEAYIMSSRYIYGSYSADNVPRCECNEFHSLSVFLGAYLAYSEDKFCNNFEEFVEKHELLCVNYNTVYYWEYVNKAHIFVRDKILYGDLCSSYVSRRQIRKLGYSGPMAPRMYPKNGKVIQQVMFDYVFTNEHLKLVKKLFLDYLYQNWLDKINDYCTADVGTKATENVFEKYLEFQFQLLSVDTRNDDYLDELRESPVYGDIQEDMEARRTV